VSAIDDLKAGWTLRGDLVAVKFSDHLVARMSERMGREMPEETVRHELSRMLSAATVTATKPKWLETTIRSGTVAFLLLGDDAVVPLIRGRNSELVGTTLMTPGHLTEKKREAMSRKPPHRSGQPRRVPRGLDRRPRRRDWGTGE
jgi:hypothetical protein